MVDLSQKSQEDIQHSLARTLVALVVPEEESLFDDLVKPSGPQRKKGRDHTLGFGVSAEQLAAASGLLAISKPILEFIWANAKDAAGDLIKDAAGEAKNILEKKMQRWIKSKFNEPPPVKLPAEKLALLVADIKADATKLGLDETTSDRLESVLRSSL